MDAATAEPGASVPDPEHDRPEAEEPKRSSDGGDHRDEAVAGGGGGGGGEEEEEEGECAFCVYMRSGPCGTQFKQWEQCVDEADKLTDEVVVKCKDTTQALMKCMEGFTDYYGVVLQAGQRMGEQSPESEAAAPSSGPEAETRPPNQGSASRAEDGQDEQQQSSSLQPQPAQILESGELPA